MLLHRFAFSNPLPPKLHTVSVLPSMMPPPDAADAADEGLHLRESGARDEAESPAEAECQSPTQACNNAPPGPAQAGKDSQALDEVDGLFEDLIGGLDADKHSDDDSEESDDDMFDDLELYNDDDESDDDIDVERPKTKAEREQAKGKRAGNPRRFRGAQEDLLLTFEPAYEGIMQMSTGRIRELAAFWANVREAYWGKFTWKDAQAGMRTRGVGLSRKHVIRATNKVSVTSDPEEWHLQRSLSL